MEEPSEGAVPQDSFVNALTKALAAWLALAVLAVANGAAREALLTPRVGELAAHQVSCVSLAVLILAATVFFVPWLGARSAPRLLAIGAFWAALTVAFEFVFGRLVAEHSWDRLLRDYDLLGGRLWVLVLLLTLLAPLLAARIRRRDSPGSRCDRDWRGA